jgi:uncharacterized protein
METTSDADDLRARLRAALRTAMKARERGTVTAIRSALAAIDNAEAVDAAAAGLEQTEHVHIAGTVGGLGAGEVARARLTDVRVREIVAGEVAERRAAADEYDGHGQDERAAGLRAEADALAALLG